MISISTNLQLNNLIRRREEMFEVTTPGTKNLTTFEKKILRFAPPKDTNDRLFFGKLQ